jgi:hypothetical protein
MHQRLSLWLRPAVPVCVQVVSGVIISTPVAYTTANGTYLALGGSPGLNCPPGQAGDIVGLRLTPGQPPNFTLAWCASSLGRGRPALIATSPDGNSTATVWALGENGRGEARVENQRNPSGNGKTPRFGGLSSCQWDGHSMARGSRGIAFRVEKMVEDVCYVVDFGRMLS